MAQEILEYKADSEPVKFSITDDWQTRKAYRIDLLITKDDEETFSAVALNLPGAGSCGSTKEDAIENAKEAIRGVISSYVDAGIEIPWKESCSQDIPFGTELKRIIV